MPRTDLARPRHDTSRDPRSSRPVVPGKDPRVILAGLSGSDMDDNEECRRLRIRATAVQRRLRDIQGQEIELGQRASAYLAYDVLRRGWNGC
jgi:hypothetical protein